MSVEIIGENAELGLLATRTAGYLNDHVTLAKGKPLSRIDETKSASIGTSFCRSYFKDWDKHTPIVGRDKVVEEVKFEQKMDGFVEEFEKSHLSGDAFEANGIFSLEEFSRVSDFMETRDRRCELFGGRVVVKELVSPYHEGAVEAFRYVFNDMTMKAGTSMAFFGEGSTDVILRGPSCFRPDFSVAPVGRCMSGKTAATMVFEMELYNLDLEKLKNKIELYLGKSVVQIVTALKLDVKRGSTPGPDTEGIILYADKSGKRFERRITLGNPVILPTMEDIKDFPDLPVIVFPNPLLFEGVPADFVVEVFKKMEEKSVKKPWVLAAVDKGQATKIIHSFDLQTFLEIALMRFMLTARTGVKVE